jgi:hypothetical protein
MWRGCRVSGLTTLPKDKQYLEHEHLHTQRRVIRLATSTHTMLIDSQRHPTTCGKPATWKPLTTWITSSASILEKSGSSNGDPKQAFGRDCPSRGRSTKRSAKQEISQTRDRPSLGRKWVNSVVGSGEAHDDARQGLHGRRACQVLPLEKGRRLLAMETADVNAYAAGRSDSST